MKAVVTALPIAIVLLLGRLTSLPYELRFDLSD